LAGRDWLQHCNNFASTLTIAKHARNIYFTLFYCTLILSQLVLTSEIKRNETDAKRSIYFTFILFHVGQDVRTAIGVPWQQKQQASGMQ